MHASMTDGVLRSDGGFLPVTTPDLVSLVKAQRLTESSRDRRLTWRHGASLSSGRDNAAAALVNSPAG
jgi:hypothetical protein